MTGRILLFSMFVANALYAGALYADASCYVQSVNAKILSEPSFKSQVVAEARMGQMLTSTGREGGWTRVTIEGKTGYVSSLLLATHPPLKKAEIIKAEDADIKEGVRRRTSSFASAAAARGLTKEDRERADIEEGVDLKSLGRMEALTFTDDEVTQFMNGGDQ
ncbi:MAG: SH3 domain-containing protein [Nitrosomonadales bacterium]|nr:SH3 domain-containing protein [Nitrosomonadales bacterium]